MSKVISLLGKALPVGGTFNGAEDPLACPMQEALSCIIRYAGGSARVATNRGDSGRRDA